MEEHEKVEGLEEERKVEYTDFIGHYQNWFKPQHIEDFINYYKYCEIIGRTKTRQEGESSSIREKADTATSYDHMQPPAQSEEHSIMGDHNFQDFLRYINGGILEYYTRRYSGFGKPLAISCKIQKTLPGEGYHIWHCEKDPTESRRVLAWMLYLNDVEEGGETEFLHQKLRYLPKKGDFLVWPASFTHLHRGNPPLSGEKYIVTGWYEYINEYQHFEPFPIDD